jgi:oligopeptide/dipeptide ABC transporter ATP-binding protein
VTAALELAGVTVAYLVEGGDDVVVRDVTLSLQRGSIVGLAGESGSGKSTLSLAAIGYAVPPMRMVSGSAALGGESLYAISFSARRRLWGARIGYVAQSANEALNPSIRIGRQLGQVLRIHQHLSGSALLAAEIELLERVGIPDPRAALRRYPHEFSGGQLQRIAIAIAVACRPEVLILDEPTTGLDVQTQQQISALLRALVAEDELATLYVSHNLALLGEISDRINIMYAGEIVERGPTASVLAAPRHPYTRALLDAVPSVARPRRLVGIPGRPTGRVAAVGCGFADRCAFAQRECATTAIGLTELQAGRAVRCRRHGEIALSSPAASLAHDRQPPSEAEPALEVRHVCCRYRAAGSDAVRDVSLRVAPGETLGLVGESGSGKSTLLRAIAGSHRPASGEIRLHGDVLAGSIQRRPPAAKRDIQLIFQNPDSSLNPAHTIGEIVRRPLRLFREDLSRADEEGEIVALLESVSLPPEFIDRYPDELSGGQKQRVAIARAFAARPTVLLCDEITSALDVSVQATVIEILSQLAASQGTAMIFVSHDLAVVRTVAARIVVLKDGAICEEGPADQVFERPQSSYTRALLAAIPVIPGERSLEEDARQTVS